MPVNHATKSPRHARVGASTIVLLVVALTLTPGVASAGRQPGAAPGAGTSQDLRLPIAPRIRPVVAAAGAEVVVFGGDDVASRERGLALPRNDGAAYNPSTGRWRTIADAPFEPALHQPSAVSIDGTVVVVGTPCVDARRTGAEFESCLPGGTAVGVYRAATDSWRRIAAPPGSGPGRTATVVGQRGGAAVVRVGPDKLWLLDPGKQTWAALPDPPLTGRLCVAGENIVAIAAEPGPVGPSAVGMHADRAVSPPGHLFTATLPKEGRDWTEPRAARSGTEDDSESAAPVCAADAVYLLPPSARGATAPSARRLNPRTNTAVPMSAPAVDPGTVTASASAGDRLVFWSDALAPGTTTRVLSYTPAADEWQVLGERPARPPDDALWLGGDRFLLVGADPTTGVRLTVDVVGKATVASAPRRAPAADKVLSDLVRRIDSRSATAAVTAAGPTAWFHEFNMAGNTQNHGGRAPADAVVYIVAGSRNKPFAIALNEVCIDWTNPNSQVRLLQTGLSRLGYKLLANIVQTKPDRPSCPQFGNVIMHIGNSYAHPRSFQYWYVDQAPSDTEKGERRGGVCARVNAFWVFFACSSHLTVHDDRTSTLLTYRFHQSAFYYGLPGPWNPPPGPDIDPAIPAIRAGDLNSTPGSIEMAVWVGDESPYVEGDDALNRPTSDSGRKIDYMFASHTTGFSSAEVSGDLSQSDHRYYAAVFAFQR